MNLHTHTDFCDGKGTPRDFVKKAIELKFSYLGFSAHAPINIPCEWALPTEKLDDYCDTIMGLQAEFSKKLTLFHGFEIDFLEGIGFPSLSIERIQSAQFFICSIHFLNIHNGQPNSTPRYIEIDGAYSQFMLAMKGHQYSLKKLLSNFLYTTEKMIQTPVSSEGVKIIGHVDKVVLNAQQLPEFEHLSDWFYDALLRILIEHRHEYDYVEINTRALYKKGLSQPYPRFVLLEALQQNQIPLLLNSDAHHPSEIAGGYKECQDKLTSLTNINPNNLQFQWPKK